jgi:hypothetical protein
MSRTVKEQIMEQVDRLDDARHRQVLDFARRLAAAPALRSQGLLRLAGSIDRSDVEIMSRAIQEGCEKVHSMLNASSALEGS